MLRDLAVSIAARRIGFRTDTDVTDALTAELQAVQSELEGGVQLANGGVFLPWFLLTEIASNTSTPDEPRVLVPADFLMETDEGEAALWLVDTEGKDVALSKDAYAALHAANPDPGQPKAYALVGQYFRLVPTPNAIYPLKIIYYAKDQDLSTNIENQWLKYAPELLMAKAIAKVAESLKDMELVSLQEARAVREALKLYNTHIARQEANASRSMGDD